MTSSRGPDIRPSISFVRSLFSLPSIISTGEFPSRWTFFISFSFPWIRIQVFFRCRSHSFPRLKCFPCSFASRQFILLECSRHLRRFVCVPINSRLSPHSNISIVPVHHLSVQHPFLTVFFSLVAPNPQVFFQDLTRLF